MKEQSVLQFAIVKETPAQTFEDRLNERIREVDANKDDITFDSVGGAMIARIAYKVRVDSMDNKLPMSETGIKFQCGDCPYFEPQRNKDGTISARAKIGDCPHSKYLGRTTRDMAACDYLYARIKNGGVTLCFSE